MALNSTRLKSSIVAKIQAISNFPKAGQTPIIQDDRVIQAIADAIVEEIVGNADVLPNTLNNPAGQPIDVTSGPGAGSTGATSAPEVIQGLGKVQ